MTIASKSVRRSYYYYYKEKERKVNFRTRFFLMLANEFLAFEHSPLFFVDIIIHCSLLRTCRVRVEEKEEFLVYTVLWTLTCHPYLESGRPFVIESDHKPLSYLFSESRKIPEQASSRIQRWVLIMISFIIASGDNWMVKVPQGIKVYNSSKSSSHFSTA